MRLNQAITVVTWQWLKGMLQDPQTVIAGLQAERQTAQHQHDALIERMGLIKKRIAEDDAKLNRLLELYLDGQFDREILLSRKLGLEKQISDLKHEESSLQEHIDFLLLPENEIKALEDIFAEVSLGLENGTFEDKRQYFELLDVRGSLAFEDGKEVIYVKCKLGKQQVLQIQTSPLLNIGEIATTHCACLQADRSP